MFYCYFPKNPASFYQTFHQTTYCFSTSNLFGFNYWLAGGTRKYDTYKSNTSVFSSSSPYCMFASHFSWNSSGSCFFDAAFAETSIVLWILNCFAIWWISQGNLQKTFGLSKVFQHSMFNVYNCWLCHPFFFFFSLILILKLIEGNIYGS